MSARGVRLLIGIPAAAVVAAGLFWVMRGLVSSEADLPDAPAAPPAIDVLAPERPEDTVRNTEAPVEPDDVTAPPPPPIAPVPTGEAPAESVAAAIGALPTPEPGIEPVASGITFAPLQPLVRPPQNYPQAALTQGTEGTCVVRFDLLPDGATTNASATCSDPVFEREARETVARYRYAPAEGEAAASAERKGVSVELVWELEE